MNRYHLVHATEFRYDGPVSESYNEVRLRPIHDEMQSCLSFRLITNPVSRGTAYRDSFGNWVHQFNILPEHHHLRVEAESVVLAHEAAQFPTGGIKLSDLDERRDALEEEYLDFLSPTSYVPHLPQLDDLIDAACVGSDGSASGFVQAASKMIHEKFSYVKGATHVNSSILDSLALGAGVCQDFAHLLLGVVRKKGLPARYVSGYLVPESAASPNAKLQEVIGGSASHAWAEVFLPDIGWLGLDPTLGRPLGLQHVRIAYGRDYGDVAPVRGVYKGHAGQRLSVDVSLRPSVDDEGNEQLNESATALPEEEAPIVERAQQPAQQQQ
ncbi:MAG TPA: transglutaminase family protein [Candidatus Acidoferrales bacterium]|jgi:transglutaminase-like putative cysteine protease|nr:transglutaminase family protein [Candidatus Acidoferrales bacterium]